MTPSPIPAPLTEAQQACITELNTSGEKVIKAQLDENERCLAHYQKLKLSAPMTFDDCTTGDRTGAVQKAREHTALREGVKCEPLGALLPFEHMNSATLNASAVAGAMVLTYEIFGGPPVLDAGLVTRADDTETARWQFEMLQRANALEHTVVEEINKAKREAVEYELAEGDSTLEQKSRAVQSTLLWNERINRVQSRLVKAVDAQCAALQTSTDAIFSGRCAEGGASLKQVEDCVIAAARCQACMATNAVDDLRADCDQGDDQTANGSCP